MLFSYTYASLVAVSCLSAVVTAVPFKFDSASANNGFPTPTGDQLNAIQTAAHGSIPKAAPPAPDAKPAKQIDPNTLTSLRFIAFNEIFEVAFFTELIKNITSPAAPGYETDPATQTLLLANLKAIQAQEELHAVNANNAVTKNGGKPIQPCEYNFPVSNLNDSIALASTFTDVVLGTLQDVATLLGTNGDDALIRGVASVIGQEGEQNGFYRSFGGKIPSALPFLTTSTRDFAFSAINQGFVVPGSCPNINDISTGDNHLNIFDPLVADSDDLKKLAANPAASDIKFSFTLPSNVKSSDWKSYYETFSLAFINQQNAPIIADLSNANANGNVITFTAKFPFDAATFGNGLTIAALAVKGTDFSSADTIAAGKTVFGPALIEVN